MNCPDRTGLPLAAILPTETRHESSSRIRRSRWIFATASGTGSCQASMPGGARPGSGMISSFFGLASASWRLPSSGVPNRGRTSADRDVWGDAGLVSGAARDGLLALPGSRSEIPVLGLGLIEVERLREFVRGALVDVANR